MHKLTAPDGRVLYVPRKDEADALRHAMARAHAINTLTPAPEAPPVSLGLVRAALVIGLLLLLIGACFFGFLLFGEDRPSDAAPFFSVPTPAQPLAR